MNKIVLSFTSINAKLLNFYIIFLKKILKQSKLKFIELNLPKKKSKISLLKSPHVYKKAWEHFEIKKYTKILILSNLEESKKNNLLYFLVKNKVKNILFKIKILK